MFIGHLAAGLAARRAAPEGSLAAYVAAAQVPDLLWPALLLAGAELVSIVPGHTAFSPLRFDSYPISHSLVMDVVWAALFGALMLWRTRARRAAMAAFLLVISHWALDVASHAPDVPLLPSGGPKLGLGLWNSVPASVAVEAALFAVAVWAYAAATRPRPGLARAALPVFVAVPLVSYAGAVFGPSPPSVAAVAVTGLAGGALLLLLAHWVERSRS
jgi:membrane-bound metal-dependent hydrolase YbcI (DUF457 family)